MSTRVLLIVGACIVTVITVYYLSLVYLYVGNANPNSALHHESLIGSLTDRNIVRDTLYFRFKDENGNVSMIHDSGIKPSTLKHSNSNVLMKIVKYEYNDGVEKILARPVELAIGQNIYNLVTDIKLTPDQVQEKRDHYIVIIDNLWK
jgi:hypothetical protein